MTAARRVWVSLVSASRLTPHAGVVSRDDVLVPVFGREELTAPSSMPLHDKLALVLLTYNCGHRIEPIVDKLLNLGLRIVAVDNASTDNTGAVLAGYPTVEVVQLDRNIGAAARNLGLERAGTPLVAFCDDDGWYELDGLLHAVALFDRHPRLAVINSRILVGDEQNLDPICAEMAESPLPDRQGLPGAVLLGFMAGAVIVRAEAYRAVGGYDPRFFIGGEEETLAMKLAKADWQMRYVSDIVVHHEPSVANAPFLRAYGLRNTLWNCWLHRRLPSALRWTWLVLADHPKTFDWARGVAMVIPGIPWVLRHRRPMSRELDAAYAVLDRRRFRGRRRFCNRYDPLRELARQRRQEQARRGDPGKCLKPTTPPGG
jgi:N-acetylglucosaminyl-diphospho-decaprenol L-rhamnosyltransferase